MIITLALLSLSLVASCGDAPRPEAAEATSSTASVPLTPFNERFVAIDSFPLDTAVGQGVIRFSGFAVNDSDGTFWIADASESRVVHFTAAGQSLKVLGTRGEGPGFFIEPRFLAVTDDSLWIGEARAKVSLFVHDSLVKTFQLDSTNFLSSLAVTRHGSLIGTTLPAKRGALMEWDFDGRVVSRALPFEFPPAPDEPESPFWGMSVQYWTTWDRRENGRGVVAIATISDSVWMGTVKPGGLTAAVVRPTGYKPMEVARGLIGPKAMTDWIHGFDIAVALFSSSKFLGYSLVRGVLYYGDPNVLMLSPTPGQWLALTGGPPVLGASADTLFALVDAGEDDGVFVVGKFVPRSAVALTELNEPIAIAVSAGAPACGGRYDAVLGPTAALLTTRTCFSCRGVGYVLRHAGGAEGDRSLPFVLTSHSDTGQVCAFLRRERVNLPVLAIPKIDVPDRVGDAIMILRRREGEDKYEEWFASRNADEVLQVLETLQE